MMTKSCHFQPLLYDRFGILLSQVPPITPVVQLVLPSLCIPPRDCISNPHNVLKPCGQPALPCVCSACPERASFPLAAPLTSTGVAWGYLLHWRGAVSACTDSNCEGILHSSVPVFLDSALLCLGEDGPSLALFLITV